MRSTVAIALLLPLLFGGCVTLSSFDRAFRSQVSEVGIDASNTYSDADTGISDSINAGVDFYLRDPSKDGLAK